MAEDKNPFEVLRSIILEDDRKHQSESNKQLLEKIDQLERDINDPEKFAQLINQSKDEVINVLGPTMGKLIRRFIKSEIDRINQAIQSRSRKIFSFGRGKKTLKTNKNEFVNSHLVQVFAIGKDSGLIIGHYSTENVLESDLIAGMLTAIKSFIESAFDQEGSELESLEYSNYSIILFELGTFYFAAVTEESPNSEIKSSLYDDFLELSHRVIVPNDQDGITDKELRKNSQVIKQWFQEKYLS